MPPMAGGSNSSAWHRRPVTVRYGKNEAVAGQVTPMIDGLARWIEGYVRAWNSNDPDDIGSLFTMDAEYSTAPFRPPRRGRDAIVGWWLENRDEPGETTFTWPPEVVTDDVAIVSGTTTYPDQTFSNLWIIRPTPGEECREFTEWWMEHAGNE